MLMNDPQTKVTVATKRIVIPKPNGETSQISPPQPPPRTLAQSPSSPQPMQRNGAGPNNGPMGRGKPMPPRGGMTRGAPPGSSSPQQPRANNTSPTGIAPDGRGASRPQRGTPQQRKQFIQQLTPEQQDQIIEQMTPQEFQIYSNKTPEQQLVMLKNLQQKILQRAKSHNSAQNRNDIQNNTNSKGAGNPISTQVRRILSNQETSSQPNYPLGPSSLQIPEMISINDAEFAMKLKKIADAQIETEEPDGSPDREQSEQEPPAIPEKPAIPAKPIIPAKPDPPAIPEKPPPIPEKPVKNEVVELQWPENTPFEKPDDPSVIIYEQKDENDSKKPKIKASTIEKLVEKVTLPSSGFIFSLFSLLALKHSFTDRFYPKEPVMQKAFLLTYRSMEITPVQLLELLKLRYSMPLPEGNEASVQAFKVKYQVPIQIRVCQLLKTWVQKHFYDFENNQELQEKFLEFVTNTIQSTHSIGKNLEDILRKKVAGESQNFKITESAPKPIIKSKLLNAVNIQITDIHPLEFARQLTIIEWNIYKSIHPSECTGLAWSKKNASERAPNVLAMINRFNAVNNWVVSEILRPETQRQRIEILNHFIEVADRCKSINNFNACMEIISGLGDSAIHRLRNHWQELPKKTVAMYDDIKSILSSDSSYKSFRAYMKTCTGACIPYLGMYLTDLTFIEDGNPDKIGELHNFSKRTFVANVIQEIQYYQLAPYILESVPTIQNYLTTIEERTLDKESAYQRSLGILPRGGGGGLAVSSGTVNNSTTPTATKKSNPPSTLAQSASLTSVQTTSSDEDYGEFEYYEGYPFYEKDSKSNIRIQETDSGSKITAGSVAKLVERVTYRVFPDPQFVEAFLLNYRIFVTGKDLIDLLIMRFNMPFPKNPNVLEKFKTDEQLPVQLRVVNIIKSWAEKYVLDFVSDKQLYTTFQDFVKSNTSRHATSLNQVLSKLDKKIEEFTSKEYYKKFNHVSSAQTYANLLDKNDQFSTLMEHQPEEVARQICLFDFSLFSQIQSIELLNRAYEYDRRRAHNLIRFSRRAQALTKWVVHLMTTVPGKDRKAMLQFLIAITHSCFEYRNYNSVKFLLLGLQSSEVKSFTPVWETVDSVYQAKYDKLISVGSGLSSAKIFNSTFIGDSIVEAAIPPIEIYVKEIVSIEDREPNFIEGGLVNVLKCRQIASVTSTINRFKNVHYNFEQHPWLHNFLIFDIDKFVDLDNLDEDTPLPVQFNAMSQDRVKLAIKYKVNEDDEIQKNLTGVLKSWIVEGPIKNELEALSNAAKAHKKNITTQLREIDEKLSESKLKSKIDEILENKYEGAELTSQVIEDKEGIVYGWSGNVQINLFTFEDKIYLYHQKPIFDKSELAVVIRTHNFYLQSCDQDTAVGSMVFANHIVPNTISIAQQNNVELISVNN